MVHELRAALRSFRHRRGLAVTIVLTLTLGIGANSAIFSVVDAVLLKGLPYPSPDRLVAVYETNAVRREATSLVAPGRLEEWNEANRSFAGLAGSYFENMTDTSGALPERLEAMRTSPRFFSVLAVPAAIGRTPTPIEETFGGPSVVILSDSFWRQRFGGDPSAVGRALAIGGASRLIIGIMPPSFRYPTATTQVWCPAQAPPFLLQARQARFYTALGRLKSGVTPAQAIDDLNAVQTRLGDTYPATDRGWGAALVPLKEEQIGGVRRSLWFLLAAVTLVLLAACANVACLLLADAARREHEVAVRLALGAGRRGVVRQLLTEGAVLAAAGAALGILVAGWATRLLRTAADGLPRIDEVRVDGRLVAFTLCLGVVTTTLFALAPALRASRKDPADALSRGGRGQAGGRNGLLRALVGGQVALAIVLLVGAGLLTRSFVRLQQVSPGFDPDGVLTFRMSAQWSERTDAVVGRQARTLARLEATPGIDAASFSQLMPAGIDVPPAEIHILGRDPADKTFSLGRSVGPGYFRTLHIPILEGESCANDPSTALASKALVTRAFADRFFPGETPVGHRLTTTGLPPGQSTAIIGIVGDVREGGLQSAPQPLIYWCGYTPYWPDPIFLVRQSPARPATMTEVRAAMRETEPGRAVYAAGTLREAMSRTVTEPRLNTVLLLLFAATALLLAAIGLYGLLSQLVSSRRREFGVRMALGAQPAHILGSVMTQAAAVAGVGLAAGLALAMALARFMATLVFGISPRDPLAFAAAPLVLAAVAAVAALVPARRAASADPMDAIRET
jgi:putative ABC transport system permease protein